MRQGREVKVGDRVVISDSFPGFVGLCGTIKSKKIGGWLVKMDSGITLFFGPNDIRKLSKLERAIR